MFLAEIFFNMEQHEQFWIRINYSLSCPVVVVEALRIRKNDNCYLLVDTDDFMMNYYIKLEARELYSKTSCRNQF